jgi:hypothetical protein
MDREPFGAIDDDWVIDLYLSAIATRIQPRGHTYLERLDVALCTWVLERLIDREVVKVIGAHKLAESLADPF